MRSAHSNNLLLDLRWSRRLGLRFDPRFGLTGGEDTMFTHDLVGRGGTIVWCDEAVVRESVPADRATRSWVSAPRVPHRHDLEPHAHGTRPTGPRRRWSAST